MFARRINDKKSVQCIQNGYILNVFFDDLSRFEE